LKTLQVQSVQSFGLDLLASLTGLEQLDLSKTALVGPRTLSVLTGLTCLQHLVLPKWHLLCEVLQHSADLTAITASSQLTHLDITHSLSSSAECVQAFPRQLPHLVSLHLSVPEVCEEPAASHVATHCPNLKGLWLTGKQLPEGLWVLLWLWVL
jgi:Leucine-rich repeat (LRR) protein